MKYVKKKKKKKTKKKRTYTSVHFMNSHLENREAGLTSQRRKGGRGTIRLMRGSFHNTNTTTKEE